MRSSVFRSGWAGDGRTDDFQYGKELALLGGVLGGLAVLPLWFCPPIKGTSACLCSGGLEREAEMGGNAFFYFRDEALTASIVEDVPGDFREADGSENARKLSELKQSITGAGLPVFVYGARWDLAQKRLTKLESFGDRVFTDLLKNLQDDPELDDSGRTPILFCPGVKYPGQRDMRREFKRKLDQLHELVGIYDLEEAFAGARMGPEPRSWCTRSGRSNGLSSTQRACHNSSMEWKSRLHTPSLSTSQSFSMGLSSGL